MAKSKQRKKPGFTKSGEVKIVSLNVTQLVALLANASKKKIKGKIQTRLDALGYVAPAVVETAEVTE